MSESMWYMSAFYLNYIIKVVGNFFHTFQDFVRFCVGTCVIYCQSVYLGMKPLETHDQRYFFPQLNPCGNSTYVTFSLMRRWVCLLWTCLESCQVYISHTSDRRLSVSQGWSRCCGEEKYLALAGIKLGPCSQ